MSNDKLTKINQRVSEGILIVTLAFAAFVLVSLCSYHASDPSWTNVTVNFVKKARVQNIGGYFGAYLADALFSLVGYVAYLLPPLIVYAAWIPLHKNVVNRSTKKNLNLTLRTVGFLVVLASGSGLAQLFFAANYLPSGAGGIIGNLLNESMLGFLSHFGFGLLTGSIFLAAITLFSGLSWIRLIDWIGRKILKSLFGNKSLPNDLSSSKLAFKANKIEPTLVVDDRLDKAPIVEERRISPKVSKNTERVILPKIKDQLLSNKEEESKAKSFSKSISDHYLKPSLELLDLPKNNEQGGYSEERLKQLAGEIEMHLNDFGVAAQVTAVHPGPVITRFELQLAAGTKVNKISNLVKDLARSLSVVSVRIVEVIQGKPVVGLEIPNEKREIIRLRAILASKVYQNSHAPLAIALGKDIAGNPVVVDLTKMPHLLVAGTTGSGKSVGLNAILLSLVYRYSPRELRLLLIDPKMLELSIYDGIPHLLAPVVTDMKEVSSALRWCVAEMERRYRIMSALGVRNIIGYNMKIWEAAKKGETLLNPLWQEDQPEELRQLKELPYLVVLADEFADMMIVVGKKIEELITRIAQKARAAGIHLILATQRPSVDVITGLIKANIPTRIAFQVSSKIDSRTILDQMGAEQLLGNGDMLYLPSGTSIPVRIHGAFVADEEVHRVANDLRRNGPPEYIDEVLENDVVVPGIDQIVDEEDDDPERDPIYDQAVQLVVSTRKVSTSSIQRRFKIGYNRAARIVEAMEQAGIVSSMETNGNREVLVPAGER